VTGTWCGATTRARRWPRLELVIFASTSPPGVTDVHVSRADLLGPTRHRETGGTA
jgi:hypothetical protein